jgi:hypothetical protein
MALDGVPAPAELGVAAGVVAEPGFDAQERAPDALELALDGVLAPAELGVAAGAVAEPGFDALELALDGVLAAAELGVAAGAVAEPGFDALELSLDGVLAPAELGVAAGVVAEPGVEAPGLALVGAIPGLGDVIGTRWAIAGARSGRGPWLMAWPATGAPVTIMAAVRIFATTPVAPSPATPLAAT